MITFQQLIERLSQYWAEKGAILHFGHDVEVGAGTFNPATFLRSLGPEPYVAAYVEPSRRPSDARNGENPNRLQLFHQYQVILKPSPPDVQEWYLNSLQVVGIDLKKHDIRFVHSDWESPTLGAWGLGWEVWCDGMEISQFTYFQAMASLPLNPISAEITYGLERLAMYIQNVDSIFDLHWNEKITFREILHQSEVEWSTYNLVEADSQMWLRHFDDYETESIKLINKGLSIAAYDFVLKASHAFNMLDARGVISVTERTNYIARVRDLARKVALEYLASREKKGFPLMKERVITPPLKVEKQPSSFDPTQKKDFLLEIGSEELPDSFIPPAMTQLEKALRALLQLHKIPFDTINIYSTPRRLSALISNLQEGSQTSRSERRGPSIAAAFNESGEATPQGEGFLKSLGYPSLTLDQIRQNRVEGIALQTIKEQDYLFATVELKGISTLDLLSQELPSLILKIDFPKKMRWGTSEISYARPLRWILALFGDRVIPFQIGDIASDHFSFGHRQLNNKKIIIPTPNQYLSLLKEHFVMADVQEREQSILNQITQIEKELQVQVIEKKKVVPQVVHLTEWPRLAAGSFDPAFLHIPSEVIASEMVEHQKYFPVTDREGHLLNRFIITADNTPSPLICQGNEKVLSARLNDGLFLYNQDLKIPLNLFNEKLAAMIFQKELGSMLDKVERLRYHAQRVNHYLALSNPSQVDRAALLSKFDLTSALVGEFPDLQGTIGKYYALAQKEEAEVAQAIEEHWMPRSEASPLPSTPIGIIISLSDKIDNLISYFSIGLKPTSSSDPYALRRQTLGILKILIRGKYPINLKTLLEECIAVFPPLQNRELLVQEIVHYITLRAKNLLEEEGFKKDEIEASLQEACLYPYDQFCKIQALHQFRKKEPEAFRQLFEVYKRAKGQLESSSSALFNEALATESAEKELLQYLHLIEPKWQKSLTAHHYDEAFHLLAKLQPPLAKLFNEVKILADDKAIQENRIALLKKVFSYFDHLLDFSKIQADFI